MLQTVNRGVASGSIPPFAGFGHTCGGAAAAAKSKKVRMKHQNFMRTFLVCMRLVCIYRLNCR